MPKNQFQFSFVFLFLLFSFIFSYSSLLYPVPSFLSILSLSSFFFFLLLTFLSFPQLNQHTPIHIHPLELILENKSRVIHHLLILLISFILSLSSQSCFWVLFRLNFEWRQRKEKKVVLR